MAENIAVSPDYFRALGAPVAEGRTFTDLDKLGADLVGMVGIERRPLASGQENRPWASASNWAASNRTDRG